MQIQAEGWINFLGGHPEAHLLQQAEWGTLKSGFGWQVVRVVAGECGAQILFRTLPANLTIGYIPKGPIGFSQELIKELDEICRERHAIFLRIEPDAWEGDQVDLSGLTGNLKPASPFQPRRTVLVSLEGSDEDILSRMKQKTRYNIRLAEKKEVIVRPSKNVDEFYSLAKTTSTRDGFGVHQLAYFQLFYDLFHPAGKCEILTAYYQEKPLASLFVARSGSMAYYMYGASSDLERNRMPTYLIQWEAMKWARQNGCSHYDLWGIPDLEEEQLEAEFSRRESHQGLWGVYRFKRGFGGKSVRSVGAWDRIYQKQLYRIFEIYQKLRGSHGD
jgi:lipid II:glycine glycyltransferase (peptidoglycan interpeptide bridge formation enzyme)